MAKRKAKPQPPTLVSRPTKGTVEEARQEARLLEQASNVKRVEIRLLDHGHYQTVTQLVY